MLLNRRSIWIVFYFLLTLVLINFLNNVLQYRGTDIVDMYHLTKILTLAEDSGALGFYLLQLYPFLVVIPAGFSYFEDTHSGMELYCRSRKGALKNCFSRLAAVFIVTFLVFTVPFLIEFLLNLLSFPMQAIGDPTNLSTYNPEYLSHVSRYFWYSLYMASPYLYTVFFISVFGLASGILGMFIAAFSMIVHVKYKVLLLLPPLILLHGSFHLKTVFSIRVAADYMEYLRLFSYAPKDGTAWGLILAAMLVFSVVIAAVKSRTDFLS